MKYLSLGHSGLKVSPLCLGTMMFGGPTDDSTAQRIINQAYEQGINFLDTADVYNQGRSEEIVGQSVQAHRDFWVIATKFGHPVSEDPNAQGQSRKWIFRAVEASLKRLKTDYLDVVYFHRAALDAPLMESLRAIADLIQQGKIRYYGVSNFRAWRIAEIVRLADKLNIDRPIVSQPLYNLLDRRAEIEQIPAAAFYKIGIVPYSPLARGILTGKYHLEIQPPSDSRAARNDLRLQQTEWRQESLSIAEKLNEYVRSRNTSLIAFSIAWVLRNRYISATIAGPRTESQWQSYLPALDLAFTTEDEDFVNQLIGSGDVSTPHYHDPAYPIEGRKI